MAKAALKIVDSGINTVETPREGALRFAREQGRIEGANDTARLVAFTQFGRDVAAKTLRDTDAPVFWKAYAEGRNAANTSKKPLPVEGKKAASYVSKARMFACPTVRLAGIEWTREVRATWESLDSKVRLAPFDAVYSAHCKLVERCKESGADTEESVAELILGLAPRVVATWVAKAQGEAKAFHEEFIALLAKADKLLNPGEKAVDHILVCEREGRVVPGEYRAAFESIVSALHKFVVTVGDDIEAAKED